MRIIKLGKGEFKTLEEIKDYFGRKLYERKPEGKFRLPRTKIGEDGLEIGEPILFSYQTVVCFTARAKSGRMNNTDEYANRFPYYFVVDMATVQPANISLQEIEDKLKDELGNKNLVHSQAWPRLDDTKSIIELWDTLRR